jgi:hypothetical protein
MCKNQCIEDCSGKCDEPKVDKKSLEKSKAEKKKILDKNKIVKK